MIARIRLCWAAVRSSAPSGMVGMVLAANASKALTLIALRVFSNCEALKSRVSRQSSRPAVVPSAPGRSETRSSAKRSRLSEMVMKLLQIF